MIHRDLKPENVFLTFAAGKPVLKLIDFGIAKARRTDPQRKKLTVAGVVMGTAAFMAPEQARSADRVDMRADLYAVGVMLYEMLAGSRPVNGDDARVIALKVERGEVVPLVQAVPDVPRELAGLVHRAMAPRADLRFASATEMRLALEKAAVGRRPSTAAMAGTHAAGPVVASAASAGQPAGQGELTANGTLKNVNAQQALALARPVTSSASQQPAPLMSRGACGPYAARSAHRDGHGGAGLPRGRAASRTGGGALPRPTPRPRDRACGSAAAFGRGRGGCAHCHGSMGARTESIADADARARDRGTGHPAVRGAARAESAVDSDARATARDGQSGGPSPNVAAKPHPQRAALPESTPVSVPSSVVDSSAKRIPIPEWVPHCVPKRPSGVAEPAGAASAVRSVPLGHHLDRVSSLGPARELSTAPCYRFSVSVLQPLHDLARRWRVATAASRLYAASAGVALVWVAALLVARHGTLKARLGAAAALSASLSIAAMWRWLERRRLRDPRRIVCDLGQSVDRLAAEKVLRALSLVEPDGARLLGTSSELARIHIERAVAGLPADRIVQRASRWASILRIASLVVSIGTAGFALANAWSVIEGLDVLLARHGVAPVTMRWLVDPEVVARPPEYVHQSEQREMSLSALSFPYGTQVTVRGEPLHPGRQLFLTDGASEVPFVDDGAGAVVARWSLTQDVHLRITARFGDVLIYDPDGLPVDAIPDRAPDVTMEGAPRQALLVEQTGDIPIKWEATDDYGLREVDLVLRSGAREERRVLARLDGEAKSDKGGQVLKLRDAFVKASHAPIRVTVEAKDNDPLAGPKWGASPAITLIPPDVGEPEARRLDALRKLRDALVDTLAWRIDNDVPKTATDRKAFVASDKARTVADEQTLQQALDQNYGGVKLPARLRSILLAQQQRCKKTMDGEGAAPTTTSHAALVKATERYALVIDAVVRGLGVRDTRESARQLADVADDLTLGLAQTQNEADREERLRGTTRADAATQVLVGGGRSMLRLGPLGRDIGEIVDAYLSRVKRGRDGGDLAHAELAARDLAARLHQPDPSFGSRGHVQRGGGESGGGRGTPGEDGEDSGDEVDQAQLEAAQDLERLAQDQAGEIMKMEQALAEATNDEELKQLREEAKRHAEAIREAAQRLPRVGLGSDSWTSKGAAARELAEQMARSLESVHPDEAAQSGRSALGSLDEAKKMLQKDAWFEDPSGGESRGMDDVRRKLEAEVEWAEQQRKEMRRRLADRARKQLEQGGEDEEKLAERARELAHRSRDKTALPEQAAESIDDAERAARQGARSLEQGDADKGIERQREAQRALELALHQLGSEEDEGQADSPGSEGKGHPHNGPVDVPKGGRPGVRAEEFRRRVMEGLGKQTSGALKESVRRYAERLLQ